MVWDGIKGGRRTPLILCPPGLDWERYQESISWPNVLPWSAAFPRAKILELRRKLQLDKNEAIRCIIKKKISQAFGGIKLLTGKTQPAQDIIKERYLSNAKKFLSTDYLALRPHFTELLNSLVSYISLTNELLTSQLLLGKLNTGD